MFVVLVFAVGMAARAGREPMMALRYGAIAFTSTASLPVFDTSDAGLLGLALAVTVTSRTLDHLIFGPLPRSTAGPQPQRPDSHMGWIRFALAYAAAAAVALWIGLTLEPLRAVWVVTTTLIVMQADARASYQRIVERIMGTFAGVLIAWLIAVAGVESVRRARTLGSTVRSGRSSQRPSFRTTSASAIGCTRR